MTEALDMTEMTQALKMTEMTDMPQSLDMSELTEALDMIEMTESSDMTEMTQALKMTEMTESSDMTEMTQALGMTEMTQTPSPNMTELPALQRSIMTEMTQALDMIKTTKTPDMTEHSKPQEITETTKILEMTKTQEMTETATTPKLTETPLPLRVTEMPKTHDEPFPQTHDAMESGWVMTIVVVGMIAVICGVVFAVYWVMFRKRHVKNASPGHVSNMAAGRALNITQQAQLGDQNSDSGLYETIPDASDGDSAYATSPYVFDLPQYHLGDDELREILKKVKDAKVLTGKNKQEDEHIYDNRSVSISDDISEMEPYATSYMTDVFSSGNYI
uniref:Uncharacterized protein n=1 Tax=Branchiostoma floridae TaxID=7739 RepID=C3Y963_BRAFL|eukprot:XP_002607109.1 hypothetical protein BRAFLDRAFT_68097 [Branchiostoma floridae]